MAKVISKTKFAGVGALVQLMGVLIAVLGVYFYGDDGLIIGGIAGLLLLIIGSTLSKAYLCSECRNPVANAKVRICPVCNENLGKEGK